MSKQTDIKNKIRIAVRMIGGEYEESKRGVPMAVKTTGNLRVHVVYFAKTKIWRVFFGTAETHGFIGNQQKISFATPARHNPFQPLRLAVRPFVEAYLNHGYDYLKKFEREGD